MNPSENIIVINPIPEEVGEWRGLPKIDISAKAIPLDTLAQNTKQFMQDISAILAHVETQMSGYQLEQVEVNCAITVGGKLSIIGIGGGSIQGEGGLKLVFTRTEKS